MYCVTVHGECIADCLPSICGAVRVAKQYLREQRGEAYAAIVRSEDGVPLRVVLGPMACDAVKSIEGITARDSVPRHCQGRVERCRQPEVALRQRGRHEISAY